MNIYVEAGLYKTLPSLQGQCPFFYRISIFQLCPPTLEKLLVDAEPTLLFGLA